MRVSESTSTEEEEIRQRIDQYYRLTAFLDECLSPTDTLAETGTDSRSEELRNDHSSISEDTISDADDTDIDTVVDQMSKEDENEKHPLYSEFLCICLHSSHSCRERTHPGQNQVAHSSISNQISI